MVANTAIQDLRLPVPARKVYRIEKSSSSPDVLLTCSPKKSAKRVCASNSSEGKRVKWSKQRVSWQLVLPELGDHEILLEVQRSLRGHRRVLINGFKRLDTLNPMTKISLNFTLAGTHSLDFIEHHDGSLQLLVDGVPFEDLESCGDESKKISKVKVHSKFSSIPGFRKFFSV